MADDENKSDVVIENFYLISEILFHLVSSSIVRAAWLNKNGVNKFSVTVTKELCERNTEKIKRKQDQTVHG
jgi:hypothetical protein